MPIKITPSKSVDIDLTDANDGEVVAVILEDGQRLFLSVLTGPTGKKFLVVESGLIPEGLRKKINEAVIEKWGYFLGGFTVTAATNATIASG